MKTKMQHGKRILEVRIKKMLDDSPDTSHLGEYANSPSSQFSIDRAHSEDCQSLEQNHRQAVDQLERIIFHLNNWRIDAGNDPENTEWESLDEAIDDCQQLQTDLVDCDCGRGEWHRNEYRFFNPSFNYVTKEDKPQSGLTPEDVRKYVRQDYERMESLNSGQWCYIGILAEARILIGDVSRYPEFASGITQTIGSGGLFGIESGSDKKYFDEVAGEELAELKKQLLTLGFSKRAISQAFKPENIKESE